MIQRSSKLCCFRSFTEIIPYWKVGSRSRKRFAQYLQRKAFCWAANQLTLFVQALPKQIQLFCLQNPVRCPGHPAVLVAGRALGHSWLWLLSSTRGSSQGRGRLVSAGNGGLARRTETEPPVIGKELELGRKKEALCGW